MPKTNYRVGTRASLLALTQTRQFTSSLKSLHPELEIEEILIQTEGDISSQPLNQSTTPGLFVSALRDALLENKVDFIVHSMKDLPASPHPQITTACVPVRQDSRDGLVSRENLTLEQLAPGASVGTSSPRRAASLRRARPDLKITSIRGNIDTRISKVQRGDYDATLLAMAGLNRIGKSDVVCQIFDDLDFVPAAGQGALSIECKTDEVELLALLAELDDAHTRIVTTAERSVLSGLNAGCATAIGAAASFNDGQLKLTAELAIEETGEAEKVELEIFADLQDLNAAHSLGLHVAELLLNSELAKKAAWN